jgi:hypothetical protein
MDQAKLRKRFKHHPPGERAAIAHGLVRNDFTDLAVSLNDLLPESREKSLVFTALEEALMWANAAIARNQS